MLAAVAPVGTSHLHNIFSMRIDWRVVQVDNGAFGIILLSSCTEGGIIYLQVHSGWMLGVRVGLLWNVHRVGYNPLLSPTYCYVTYVLDESN